MSWEPAWSVPVVLITGFAALILYYLASQATIFDRVFAYPRDHWGPLWNCPWCLSFWTTGVLLVATGTYDPVTHLAAWGFAGFMGSHSG